MATGYVRGDPIPAIDYTAQEDDTWRIVRTALAQRHRTHATREFLAASAQLNALVDHVPQLQQISDRLHTLTGFRLQPVGGMAPFRDFRASLADSYFQSTQYVRPPDTPLYSTEPDILHEIIGHCAALADERLAALYRLAGHAVVRVRTDEALDFLGRLFWFVFECGVLYQAGEVKVYGATLTSSVGEIDHLPQATIRPLDLVSIGTAEYDIARYQDLFFAAGSLTEIEDVVGDFLATCDDEAIAKLLVDSRHRT